MRPRGLDEFVTLLVDGIAARLPEAAYPPTVRARIQQEVALVLEDRGASPEELDAIRGFPVGRGTERLLQERVDRAWRAGLDAARAAGLQVGANRPPRVVWLREEAKEPSGGPPETIEEILARTLEPEETEEPGRDPREDVLVLAEGRKSDRAGAGDLERVRAELEQTLLLPHAGAAPRAGGTLRILGVPKVDAFLPEALLSEVRASRGRRARPAELPEPGTLLSGKYRLTRTIGTGGFGAVYEAVDTAFADVRHAIKILNPSVASKPGQLEAFKQEARRVTRLDHPNIVNWRVFDEAADGTCYFVMEFLDGEELHDLMKREGRLEPDRVARFVLQILAALRCAHGLSESESILHLDLKPKNVFLVPDKNVEGGERIKVIDFGIGQHIGGRELESTELDGSSPLDPASGDSIAVRAGTGMQGPGSGSKQRASRSVACTPQYASPEQAAQILAPEDAPELDGRSDLYSLGVMTFQMLTGELPYVISRDPIAMLRARLQEEPARLSSKAVKVPRDLARFVELCLRRDPAERWPSTEEAYRFVDHIVHPRVARKVALALVGVLIVAGISFALVVEQLGGPPQDQDLVFDGGQVERLYMGPARPVLELNAPWTSELEDGATLEVIEVERDSPVRGFTARTSPTGVLLEARQGELGEGTRSSLVKLRAPDGVGSSRSFQLDWIGAAAWGLPTERAWSFQDLGEDELGGLRVDPVDNPLLLRLTGDVESIEQVRATLRGSDGVTIMGRRVHGAEPLFVVPVEDLPLSDGRATVELVVRDRAQREAAIEASFVAAPETPEPEASLPGRATPDGLLSIATGEDVELDLNTSQPFDLTWSLLWKSADREVAGKDATGRTRAQRTVQITESGQVLIPFSALGEREEPRQGILALFMDDSSFVLRSEERARPREIERFEFRHLRGNVDVTLRVEGNGTSLPSADLPLLETEADEVQLQADPELLLSVFRAEATSGIRLALVPSWNESEPEPRIEDLMDLEVASASVRHEATADGVQRLTLEVGHVGGSSGAILVSRTRALAWIVDRTPAALGWKMIGAEVIDGPHPEEWRVELSVHDADYAEGAPSLTPVGLSWELRRAQGGVSVAERLAAGTIDHLLHSGELATLKLADLLPGATSAIEDGEYRLRLSGTDLAGNRCEFAEAGDTVVWQVARTAPEVRVLRPESKKRWNAVGGAWGVVAEVGDQNGILRVTAQIRNGERVLRQLELLDPKSTGVPSRWEFRSGPLTFDYAYKELPLTIEVEATSLAGEHSSSTLEQVLVETDAHPAGIRWIHAETGLARGCTMRFVPGTDGEYAFHGRVDDVEERAFLEAELGSFRGEEDERSWKIRYDGLPSFFLDQYEVSRGEFQSFLLDPSGYREPASWSPDATPSEERRNEWFARIGDSDHELPVTGVTWYEADAYARWAGKRLPTLVEYEYAVRGGIAYRPFASFEAGSGSGWPGQAAVNHTSDGPWTRGSGHDVTADTSIHDLSGNVREWTCTPFLRGPRGERLPTNFARNQELYRCPWEETPAAVQSARRFVAGYSFEDGDEEGRVEFLCFNPPRDPDETFDDVGFRCALSETEVLRSVRGAEKRAHRYEEVSD